MTIFVTWQLIVTLHWTVFAIIAMFRHASVSSTYPGQSVRRPSVKIFGFPFCQRHWDLTKRRDNIAVADMEVDMVANMEVDKVANKVTTMVADEKE